MRKLIFTIFSALPVLAFSQSADRHVIGSAGTVQVTNDFNVSSTIGETIIATGEADGIILNQGFQQALDYGLTVEDPEFEFSATAFPNPTMDGVTLDLNAERVVALNISLFDVSGKQYAVPSGNILLLGKVQKVIDMNGFASGVFFIRFTDDTGELNKTIKVQKVN